MMFYELIRLLEGQISSENFSKEIMTEVSLFRSRKAIRGSVVPIVLTGETPIFSIGVEHVMCICSAYCHGDMDEMVLEYICNAIDMSESFEISDPRVGEVIDLLANPEIHFPISQPLVTAAIDWLTKIPACSLNAYLPHPH